MDIVAGRPLPSGLADEPLLATAWEAAHEAGALLLARFDPASRGPLAVRSKSSATDAVTDLDVAAERVIVDRLTRNRPQDAVLAEEGGEVAPHAADGDAVQWVVDPLDGTVNFLYGLPHWAVSIAARRAGATVVGVVHAPALGETAVAVRGAGAWHVVDGRVRPMAIGAGVRLERALIATGFSYSAEERRRQAAIAARLLPQVRDIRRLGAAAVDLVQVALGRVDAFYEAGLQPWDVAAGALIVTEAGGRVEEVVEETVGAGMVGAGSARRFVIAGPGDTVRALGAVLGPGAASGDAPGRKTLAAEPTVP
jgi:myo-inositol-1(or 4)-monophosphatase